jgi:hypothetical protein
MRLITKILIMLPLISVLLFGMGGIVDSQETPADEKTGTVILEPAFQELKVDEDFKVAVIINSEQPIVGVDVVIKFDPEVLKVISIDEGDAFPLMPLKVENENFIKITGLAEGKEPFSGNSTLASIQFKAKSAAETKLEIDRAEGSTTDSNFTTSKVTDVLGTAEAGNYKIGTPVERGIAGVRKLVVTLFPIAIFLVILGIVGFLGYRWWKRYQNEPKDVFIPEHVPLDKPPEEQPPVV